MKYDVIFSLRDLVVCMKTKTFFFQSLDENQVLLISDLYLYGIKIQTNIKQNSVTKYTEKSLIFLKIFGTGPDPAKKKIRAESATGLDSAQPRGLG